MPICRRCHTECDERDRFCSHCGNLLVTEEKAISCQEDWFKVSEDKEDKEQLNVTDPEEAQKEPLPAVFLEKQDIEKTTQRLICPRCKIIYERGDACIRCSSPLVEKTSSTEREDPDLSSSEACKEELLLSSGLEAHREEPKTADRPEAEDEPSQGQSSEQLPLNRLPINRIRTVGFPRKNPKKGYRLFLELVSIIILIAAPGYLIWSIVAYFVVEKPEASMPADIKVDPRISPRSSAVPNSSTPVTAPHGVASSMPAKSKLPFEEGEEVEKIRTLLENIRQANLKKNIDLFMSCYSPGYKDREGKKKETIETWENFNYLHLSYDLKKHSVSGSTAQARVEWLIRFSPKAGGQFQESKAVLEVTFTKEEDGWKVKEIKPLS